MGSMSGYRYQNANGLMRGGSVPGHLRAARMGFWAYVPLAAALLLRLASGPTANLSYLVLAVYALLGRPHAIRALAMSWLFTMINPGIAPAASAGAIGRYSILFAAALSAIIHSGMFSRQPRMRPFTVATILLGLFITIHSMLFSPMVDVSVLKAVSWTLAMATSISVWCGLSAGEREEVSEQIFRGLVVLLVVSLPLAATSLGYMRNGSGFQGILNHPQAFGPTMALLGAWATSRLLGAGIRPPWWLLGVAAASLACIVMSEARTAGLGMMLAVGLAVLIGPGLAERSIAQMLPGLRSVRIWGVLLAVSMASLVMAPTIASKAQNFISKSGRAQVGGFLDAYDRSRGGLIDKMVANIAEHPLTGIGFGIASELETMDVSRDPVLGLPIGASIEKGVVPLATLEELGVIGAFLVLLWVFRLLRTSARGGVDPLAVCLTVLVLNMGEATFFSPGGLGLLPMILLGWSYANGRSSRPLRHG
jgi:hypothetical protein